MFGGNKPTQSSGFSGASGDFGQQGGFGKVATPGIFGQQTQTAFGQSSDTSPAFGATAFGSPSTSSTTPSMFGQSKPAFGGGSISTGSAFGSNTAPGFGAQTTPVFSIGKTPAAQGFGSIQKGTPAFSSAAGAFGQPAAGAVFGATGISTTTSHNLSKTTAASIFGANKTTNPVFSSAATTTSQKVPSAFGGTSGFGAKPVTTAEATSAAFGGGQVSSSVFGGLKQSAFSASQKAGPFGSSTTSSTGIFGKKSETSETSVASSATSNVFASVKTEAGPNVFGGSAKTDPTPASSVFGGTKKVFSASSTSSIFGGSNVNSTTASTTGNVFGGKGTVATSTGLFGKPATGETGATSDSKLGTSTGGFGTKDDNESKPVFGRKTGTENTGLFGQKPSIKEESESDVKRALFGERETEGEKETKRRIIRRPKAGEGAARGGGAGLFGRAISGVAGSSAATRHSEGTSRSRERESERGKEDKDKPVTPDSSTRASRPALRRSTSAEIAKKVAIVCKMVPRSMNNKISLKKHFSKYGRVTRIFPNPNKGQATIHFSTHATAEDARRRGRHLEGGYKPLQIFWGAHNPAEKESPRDKPESSSRSRSAERPKPKAKPRSEVDEELQAMLGTEDIGSEEMHVLQRPDEKTLKMQEFLQKRGIKPPSPTMIAKAEPRKKEAVQMKRAREPSPVKRAPEPVPTRSVSPAPVVKIDNRNLNEALRALENTVAFSANERFELLEKRDKILRQGRTKETDMSKVQVMRGTCMDMCPEPERYMREDRRRLSIFEIIPGTDLPGQNPQVDHSRAVKEYSRSSADQDMPLLHEMRPAAVLTMTMAYLCNCIMDRGEENWAEWFDFIWNRTRAIRKDITQQHLCDLTSVELEEKCCRFHIYCSERLVEEDMHTFSPKINDENLTKCLQSLKEMYEDLRINRGVQCPLEGEFRAYMVLMRLNEGDILREVMELPPAVRNTPEVQFALKVHLAVNSNNYIQFFKLVRQARYLPACIMHRYFNQVRLQALKIMTTVYFSSAKIPLANLQHQLGFEGEFDVEEFCTYHGLQVEEGCVLMTRKCLYMPENPYSPRRAEMLIEIKLTTTVGEAINAAPLPPFKLKRPNTSFDNEGKFHNVISMHAAEKPEQAQVVEFPAIQMAAPVGAPEIAEAEQERPPPPPYQEPQQDAHLGAPPPYQEPTAPPKPQPPAVSNEIIKDIARTLFREVIDEMALEMSNHLVTSVKVFINRLAEEVSNDFLDDQCRELTRPLCKEVVEEELEKQEEERRLAQARQEALAAQAKADASQTLAETLLEETLASEVNSLAQQQMRDVREQLKAEAIEGATASLSDELLREVVTTEMAMVSQEVYEVNVEQRLQELQECEKYVEILRTSRFFKRWRNVHAGRIRLKKSMYNFPPAPSGFSQREQLQYLLPERTSETVENDYMQLGKRARLTVQSQVDIFGSEKKLAESVSSYNAVRRLRHKKAWAPLDLAQTVGTRLALRAPTTKQRSHRKDLALYWKLVLSIPEQTSPAGTSSLVCDWLKSKFKKGLVATTGQSNGSELLSCYTCSLKSGRDISLCVQACVGTLTESEIHISQENYLLQGTTAILFMMRRKQDTENNGKYYFAEQIRLSSILQAKPTVPSLPLVVLTPQSHDQDQGRVKDTVMNSLSIGRFIDEGLVSCCEVVTIPDDVEDPKATNQLVGAVRWLSDHCPPQPKVESEYLMSLLEDALTRDFYTPLYQNLTQRRRKGLLHQSPEAIIALYNSLMDHLANVVSSQHLESLSWPITEFIHQHTELPYKGWNSVSMLSELRDILYGLCLPEFDHAHQESEGWEAACEDVWAYVEEIILLEDRPVNHAALCSRIRWLLRRAKEDFENVCYLVNEEEDCEPTYVNMPWTEIIAACVQHQITNIDLKHRHQLADEEVHDDDDDDGDDDGRHGGGDLEVYYLQSELEKFSPPSAWREVVMEQNEADCADLESTLYRAAKRKQEEEEVRRTPAKLSKTNHAPLSSSSSFIDLDAPDSTTLEADEKMHELKSSVTVEKQQNKKYEEYLRKVLMEGDISNVLREEEERSNMAASGAVATTEGEDMTDDLANPSQGVRSLAEGFNYLQQEIASNKKASLMFEMKLQRLLMDLD